MQKRIEMLFDARTAGVQQLREMAEAGERLNKSTHSQTVANNSAAESHRRLGLATAGNVAHFAALSAATYGYVQAIKGLTVESATFAARTQTLSVVTDQLARVNNLNVAAVRQQVFAVRDLGITTQESYQTVAKMIFANLDLAKATDLARLSQNAAVIAGQNSSEALAGIIHGITTRQPEVLRTYGIIVTFEQEYAKVAKQLGRELSATEKTQVALNLVLREGAKIQGAYEAAMGTTGKQLTSLTRFVDEAKNAIGDRFAPALSRTVTLMTDFAKWAKEDADTAAQLTSAVTAASLAIAAYKLTPGPPTLKGVVAGAVGLGAYFGMSEDPVEFARSQASTQLERVRTQRSQLNAERKAGTVDADTFIQRSKAFDILEAQLQAQFINTVAPILASRPNGDSRSVGSVIKQSFYWPNGQRMFPPTPNVPLSGFDLGGGTTVSADQIRAVMAQLAKPGKVDGPLQNQELLRQAQEEAELERKRKEAEKWETKARQAQERVARLEADLREKGVEGTIAKLESQRMEDLRVSGLTGRMRSRINTAYEGLEQYELSQIVAKAVQEATVSDFRREQAIGVLGQAVGQPVIDPSQVLLSGYLRNFYLGKLPIADESMLGQGFWKGQQLVEDSSQWDQDREQQRERGIALLRQEQAHRERMVQLLAGPGGEIQAAKQLYDLRLQHALDLYEASRKTSQDLAAYQESIDQARFNREQELAQLRRKEIDDYRNALGKAFDAMNQKGGAGLGDMARAYGMSTLRQLFVNTGTLGFDTVRRSTRFEIPGQTGADGKPTTLGRIFGGTIFGTDPLKGLDISTRSNTAATVANTGAISRLSQSLATAQFGGGFGGGLGVGSVAGTAGAASGVAASSLPGIGGYDPSNPVYGGASSLPTVGGYNPSTASMVPTATRPGSGVGKAFGTGAILAAGGFGVYSGIRQGGAQGALTAVAAGAGTAAALDPEPISRGILMGVAAAAGIVGALLGNPKERYSRSLERFAQDRQFTEPTVIDNEFDLYGNNIDYNRFGQIRTYKLVKQEIKIDAVDYESFRRHKQELLEIVREGAIDGHPYVDALSDSIRPS